MGLADFCAGQVDAGKYLESVSLADSAIRHLGGCARLAGMEGVDAVSLADAISLAGVSSANAFWSVFEQRSDEFGQMVWNDIVAKVASEAVPRQRP